MANVITKTVKYKKGLLLKTGGKYCENDINVIPDSSLFKKTLQEKEITENGEYVADEGYDGFSKVTVNILPDTSLTKYVVLQEYLNAKKGNLRAFFYHYNEGDLDSLLNKMDLSNGNQMIETFSQSEIGLSKFVVPTEVTSLQNAFYSCKNLIDFTLEFSETNSNCTFFETFRFSTNLKKLTITGGYKITSLNQLCNDCSLLEEIVIDSTENVNNMNCAFSRCSALTTVTNLNTSKVTIFYGAFRDCTSLTTLILDLDNATNVFYMLENCSSLTNLTLLNIKINLQIGNGSSWGHLLTLESLINTVKELINVGSAKTLTMGTANLEKIASTYVKFTDSSVTTIPTNEKGDVVVCESTDTGAMLLSDYALLKNWTLA